MPRIDVSPPAAALIHTNECAVCVPSPARAALCLHVGVPRATRAISVECPHGNPNAANDKTVIQQHVDFWDRDKAGRLTRIARLLRQ